MYSRGGRGVGRGGGSSWRHERDDYSRRYQRPDQDGNQGHNPGHQYNDFSKMSCDPYDNKRQRVADTKDYYQEQYGNFRGDEAGGSQRSQKERPPPHLRGRAIENRDEFSQSWSRSKGNEQHGFGQREDFSRREPGSSGNYPSNDRDQELFDRNRGSLKNNDNESGTRRNYEGQEEKLVFDQQNNWSRRGSSKDLDSFQERKAGYERQQDKIEEKREYPRGYSGNLSSEYRSGYSGNQSNRRDFPVSDSRPGNYNREDRVNVENKGSQERGQSIYQAYQTNPGDRSAGINERVFGDFSGQRFDDKKINFGVSNAQWEDTRKRTFEGEQSSSKFSRYEESCRDIRGHHPDIRDKGVYSGSYTERNVPKTEQLYGEQNKSQWSDSRNILLDGNNREHLNPSKSGIPYEDNRSQYNVSKRNESPYGHDQNKFDPYKNDPPYSGMHFSDPKTQAAFGNYRDKQNIVKNDGVYNVGKGPNIGYMNAGPSEVALSQTGRGNKNEEPYSDSRISFSRFQERDPEMNEFEDAGNIDYSDDELSLSDSEDNPTSTSPDRLGSLTQPDGSRTFAKRKRKKPLKAYVEGIPIEVMPCDIKKHLRKLGFSVRLVERMNKLKLFYILLHRDDKALKIHEVKQLAGHKCHFIENSEYMRRLYAYKWYQKHNLLPPTQVNQRDQAVANSSGAALNSSAVVKQESGPTVPTNPALINQGDEPQRLNPRKKRVKPIRIFIKDLPMDYLKENIRSELNKLKFKVRQVNRNKGLGIFHVQFAPTDNIMDIFKITTLGGHPVQMIEPKVLCDKPRFTNQVLPGQ